MRDNEIDIFIADRLRRAGVTVQVMLEEIGIPKPTYFRQKRTGRFSAKNLRLIAGYFRLSEKETEWLFSLTNVKPSSIQKDEQNRVRQVIEEILFSAYAEFKQENIENILKHETEDFILFQSDTECAMTARQLAHLIERAVCTAPTDKKNTEFSLNIWGCTSAQAVTTIMDMALNIMDVFYGKDEPVKFMRVSHFIDFGSQQILDKFEIFKAILPLIASVPDYCFCDREPQGFPWGATNLCLLKCRNSDGAGGTTQKYIVCAIDQNGLARVYMTPERALSDFFDVKEDERTLKRYFEPNAIDLCAFVQKETLGHPKVLLAFDICFDNILPEAWDVIIAGLAGAGQNNGAALAAFGAQLRHAVDPFSKHRRMTDAQFIGTLRDSLAGRFAVNEEHEALNLISLEGLTQFAETGRMQETKTLPDAIRFSDEQIVKQLGYFKAQLGDLAGSGKQRYFIVKKHEGFPPLQLGFLIFKDAFTYPIAYDFAYSLFFPSGLTDVELANTLYEYFTAQIAERGTKDSILMSDKAAAAEIEKLIRLCSAREDARSKTS